MPCLFVIRVFALWMPPVSCENVEGKNMTRAVALLFSGAEMEDAPTEQREPRLALLRPSAMHY